MSRARPLTVADVVDAIRSDEALTVREVGWRVLEPADRWPRRQTVRNRLWDAVALGELIADDERPVRFALPS